MSLDKRKTILSSLTQNILQKTPDYSNLQTPSYKNSQQFSSADRDNSGITNRSPDQNSQDYDILGLMLQSVTKPQLRIRPYQYDLILQKQNSVGRVEDMNNNVRSLKRRRSMEFDQVVEQGGTCNLDIPTQKQQDPQKLKLLVNHNLETKDKDVTKYFHLSKYTKQHQQQNKQSEVQSQIEPRELNLPIKQMNPLINASQQQRIFRYSNRYINSTHTIADQINDTDNIIESVKPFERKQTFKSRLRQNTYQLDTIQVQSSIEPLKKENLIQFHNSCDIEDFFKIDTNLQANSKLRQRKNLSNIYKLTSFTDWVEELYGEKWFQEKSLNISQNIRNTRSHKLKINEVQRGIYEK